MKEQDSREKLIIILENYISRTRPQNKTAIEEELAHDGKFTNVIIYNIMSGRQDMAKLSNAELFWLASAIFRVNSRLGKIEDFFENEEINNYKYYDSSEENIGYPLTFKNVCKLAKNQYMFPLTIQEIKDLKSSNILQIIPELQRNHKKDRYGDLKTRVDKNTATEIATLISTGNFFYNGIRFNLMDDGDAAPPEYDENAHTLKIESGTIIVPDGNHRTIGCELANEHLDDSFGVFFTYLPTPETRKLLNQEWTTVPIPKAHREAMRPTVANKIVEAILRSPDIDPIYKEAIVKEGVETVRNNGFIIFIDLANAIEKYYDTKSEKFKTQADQDELKEWLISFMNAVAKFKYDDFANFTKVKRRTWSVSSYAWHYYICISKALYKKEGWRDKLKKILDKTDFESAELRHLYNSGNKRAVNEWIKGKEEEFKDV